MTPPISYDVSLSFAGEDREYVERVAQSLRAANIRVFYDAYEEVALWGRDLYQHLAEVYSNSRYCVIFVSASYARKVWPRHELRSAQARALGEQREYILPARFDNTEVPGLPQTIAYIDLSTKKPDELAHLIIKKLSEAEELVPDGAAVAATQREGVVSSPPNRTSMAQSWRIKPNESVNGWLTQARVRWVAIFVIVFALAAVVANRFPSPRRSDQENCGLGERWVGMRPSRAEWSGHVTPKQADHASFFGELRWTPIVDQVRRTTVGRVELEVDGLTTIIYRWDSPKTATHSFMVPLGHLLVGTSGRFKIRWVWEDGTSGICIAKSVIGV